LCRASDCEHRAALSSTKILFHCFVSRFNGYVGFVDCQDLSFIDCQNLVLFLVFVSSSSLPKPAPPAPHQPLPHRMDLTHLLWFTGGIFQNRRVAGWGQKWPKSTPCTPLRVGNEKDGRRWGRRKEGMMMFLVLCCFDRNEERGE